MRKVVIVTGASSGIGAATAILAAARGYDVGIGFANGRNGAEQVAQQVQNAGGKAALLQGDVADPNDVQRIFAQCDAELGPLAALVNNAGIGASASRVADLDHPRLKRMFEINVIGCFLCAQQAVRRMSTRTGGAGGVIVNVSSKAATLGGANVFVDYAASKGAIDTFTKGLSDEEAAYGIRVNGIRPGIIITDFHDKMGEPDRVSRFDSMIPLKRAGSAEEVAEAILWLMSDQASYVTGTTFDVSGGR